MRTKLVRALRTLEDALRHVKRAKNDSDADDDNLRKAKREIEDAIQQVRGAISESPD